MDLNFGVIDVLFIFQFWCVFSMPTNPNNFRRPEGWWTFKHPTLWWRTFGVFTSDFCRCNTTWLHLEIRSASLTGNLQGPESDFRKKHEILGGLQIFSRRNIEFESLVFSRASWVHFVAIALDPNLKRVPDIIVSMWCLRVFLHPFL